MSQSKSGLGRGLNTLLHIEEPPNTLPVDQLRPNRWQPRSLFDEQALEELTESIRAQGVIQPLVVTTRDGEAYTIVAGERRWRAARRAGLTEVPVVVREITGDRELLELALVENVQRTDLNPMEEAEAYRSLHESFGLSHKEMGARVGRGRVAVTNALRLLNLPEETQDSIRSGQLSPGQARPLLSLEDPERQLALGRRAVREGLSARQLEAMVRPQARKARRAPKEEPHASAAAEKLTKRLQTKVKIDRRGKGGTIRLHFHSEEELMRLYDLLMGTGK